MEAIETKIAKLYEVDVPLTKRPDFDEFWAQTITEARAVPLRPERTPIASYTPYADIDEIAYNGFDETRIYGWLIVPKMTGKAKLPCVVAYHGFGGSRGEPHDWMQFAMAGCAVLSVDCRMQGGKTGNTAAYSNGLVQNVTSLGILDKNEYYFRAVYMDCLKAIDFAESCAEVDADRIILFGGSQGGALGMAVACLDSRPKLTIVNVPSNSNLTARVEGEHGTFSAVADYLRRYPDKRETAYETLSYFDTMNMADKITCPVYVSVGMQDNVCPPEMYFASYNRIMSEKNVEIYPFNGHEGGGRTHMTRTLLYLRGKGLLD